MNILNTCYLSLFIFLQSLSFPSNGSEKEGGDSINISVKDYAALNLDHKTIILDVRTEREFAKGHLENAILLNIYKPDFRDKVGELDKSLTYYVYCATGIRSVHAVKYMRSIGIISSYNVKEGIHHLANEGVKIVK